MDGDLRNMVMSFRVTELQTLLAYAGKNRTGRKNELQARALELVKGKSSPIVSKIKELYRASQQSGSVTSTYAATNNGVPHNQPRLYQNLQVFGQLSDKANQAMGQNFFNLKPQTMVTMPICPDVKMKRLPFYDILGELIKPSSLMPQQPMGRAQEGTYSFCLTPQQAADISESKEYVAGSMGDQKLQYSVQVQLRFCTLEPHPSGEQDDQFPPNLNVKVNGKIIQLPHPIPSNRPGVEPKRPSRPLNVTNFVKLCPTVSNGVIVSWGSDNTRGYAMSLYLVRKLTSNELLSRLKQKGPRPADYSKGLVKELIAKSDGDCMIAMTSFRVSIACPLGKCRMSLPSRATTCKHLQCFDANLFLQMNERKPTWVCPVCDKPTKFDDLCIDGYFQEVISQMAGTDNTEIEVLPDGSWKVVMPKKKDKDKEESGPPAKKMKSDSSASKANVTINLDDDILIDEDSPKKNQEPASSASTSSNEPAAARNVDIIDLTIDSSSDEEEEEAIRPRRKAGKKPNYVIEDDDSSRSSCSSSTSAGSAVTLPRSPAKVAPMSPACITLDSRSPSPEIPPAPVHSHHSRNESSSTSSRSASNSAAPPVSSASSYSTSTSSRPPPDLHHLGSHSSRLNAPTSFDYGHGHSVVQPGGFTRSNPPQAVSPNLFAQSGAGYMPSFDGSNMWGTNNSTSNFQNMYPTPDFSHLDLGYDSLGYGGFDSTSSSRSGYRWP